MTHDHSRISAVLDGECSPAERDEVLAHVAGCSQCREFVRVERAAKAALRGTGATADPAPAALLASLRSLATVGPGGHPGRSTVPSGAAERSAGSAGRPLELPDQHRRRVRRAFKGLGLALASVGGLCAAAFALGDISDVPEAHPSVARFDGEHDLAVAATAPMPDRATESSTSVSSTAAMVSQPSADAAVAPPATTVGGLGLRAASVLDHGDVLHLTYGTGAGAVSVFWQRGVIGRQDLDGFVKTRVDGGEVLIRPGNPRVAVWSTGKLTVTVVGPDERVEAVTRALPHDPPVATGVVARIGRGMHRASGWVDPLD